MAVGRVSEHQSSGEGEALPTASKSPEAILASTPEKLRTKAPTPVDSPDVERPIWRSAVRFGFVIAAISAVGFILQYLGGTRSGTQLESNLLFGSCPSFIIFTGVGIPLVWIHRKLSIRFSSSIATMLMAAAGFALLAASAASALLITESQVTSGGDTTESPPAPAPPAASQPTQGWSDVCNWFFATQTLRSRRISGLSELTMFLQTHDLNNLSEAETQKFVDILVRYQPYQREFMQAWEELGPNLDASPFWEKEWEAVQLRILAINDMERGMQQNDFQLFLDGVDTFTASQQIGLELEAAMMDVRSRCVN